MSWKVGYLAESVIAFAAKKRWNAHVADMVGVVGRILVSRGWKTGAGVDANDPEVAALGPGSVVACLL